MSFSTKFFNVAFACGASFLVMYPVAANAGFEWTPPPAPVVQVAPVVQNVEPVNGPLTPEPDASIVMEAAPAPVSTVDTAPLVAQQQRDVPPTPGLKFLPAKEVPTPASAPEPMPVASAEPVALNESAVAPALPVVPTPAPAPAPEPAPVATPAPAPVAPVVVPQSASAVPAAPASAEEVKTVEGFGKDIPLALALRDIAPSEYAYVFEAGEMAGRRISWRGGKQWQDVLDAALAPVGLQAKIDGKVIMISGLAKASDAAQSTIPSADVVTSSNTTAPAAPEAVAEEQPVAKKTAMPVVDLTVKRQWDARTGKTLREVLEQWSADANVDLNWSTAYDYPISNAFYFEGTYGDAVDAILSSYRNEHPAPKGRLYPNLPDGPSVLMIN